jgi:hypothetical protein
LIGLDGQDAITSDSKRGPKWLPGILSGGDVHRFFIQQNGAYILFDKSRIKSGYDCVDYSIPKLFMRQTGDTLVCAFDPEGLLCLNNVHVGNAKSKSANLKFLCGLLNSKLLNFFYRAISLETGRVMPQTDIETLDDLPVPAATSKDESTIERLVDSILAAKERDAVADTSALERQIDSLVYSLYGLTPEEIDLVESSTAK